MTKFNPHNNVTADGVVIVEGLQVVTNEIELGTVRVDEDCGSGAHCCYPNGAEHFEADGQVKQGGVYYSDHQVGYDLQMQGCTCRHDHWFRIETAKGTKSFNGERLGAASYGGVTVKSLIEEYN